MRARIGSEGDFNLPRRYRDRGPNKNTLVLKLRLQMVDFDGRRPSMRELRLT